MYREALSDEDDSGEDDVDVLVTALYSQAKRKCFHFRKGSYRKRSTFVLDHYLEMEDSDFLLHLRLHKESFWKLLHIIESSDVFQRKRNVNGTFYKPQCPVKYQLLILLYVLGASGSDSNYRKVGSCFYVSSGAVQLYVDRCTAAIISSVEHEVIYWPDDVEQKYICNRIQDKYGFPNCVGFVNETILPLEFKPSLYGEEYYCRKGCCLYCIISKRSLRDMCFSSMSSFFSWHLYFFTIAFVKFIKASPSPSFLSRFFDGTRLFLSSRFFLDERIFSSATNIALTDSSLLLLVSRGFVDGRSHKIGSSSEKFLHIPNTALSMSSEDM
jgi:hypothetical protein